MVAGVDGLGLAGPVAERARWLLEQVALSRPTASVEEAADRLRAMAATVEEYELSTPYTPEPEGAACRGLYVDQVYF